MRKFIDFEEVEKLATIEELADMLGLKISRSATQLRCSCPVHGGDDRALAISPGVRSKRGSEGVFFCQKAQQGGDRIGLVAHCMDIGQQDAAFFIAEQFGSGTGDSESTSTSTGTVSTNRAKTEKPAFDPVQFAGKLAYTDEVKAAFAITEEEAKAFRIGFYRGKVWVPQVYPSGVIAGWSSLDGTLKHPGTWLPDNNPNVVPFKKVG